jgi:NAD(P)-dependent dehydrogenase (short-subunit alcohol dehydrogenase family)
MRLKDKVAVITGASSGIGLMTARAFAREGAEVAIAGRNGEALAALQQELGPGALAVTTDISQVAEIERLFAAVKERFGRVDVLVANAGTMIMVPFEHVDEASFDTVVSTNLKGTFFTVQKALPLLSAGASVILMSSSVHQKAMTPLSVYAATKAGLGAVGGPRGGAHAPRAIPGQLVSPGAVDTPFLVRSGLPEAAMPAMREQAGAINLLGRMAQPEEIASVAVFLASAESAYMTAADVVVDAGWSLV